MCSVDTVWEERAPPLAAKNVGTHVCEMRKVLPLLCRAPWATNPTGPTRAGTIGTFSFALAQVSEAWPAGRRRSARLPVARFRLMLSRCGAVEVAYVFGMSL